METSFILCQDYCVIKLWHSLFSFQILNKIIWMTKLRNYQELKLISLVSERSKYIYENAVEEFKE